MRAVGSLITAAVTAAAPALASVPARTPQHGPVASAMARTLPRPVTNPIASRVAPEVRAAVTGVSVLPGTDAAASVLIRVDRVVEVQDFVLDGPRRVVLDLTGATLAVAVPAFHAAKPAPGSPCTTRRTAPSARSTR